MTSTNDTKNVAETLKQEGNELFRAGKYTEALEKYQRACERNPSVATYLTNAAACHEELEDFGAMKRASKRAVEVDDKFSKGYYRLAVAYMKLEKFSKSKEAINKGLAIGEHLSDFELLQLQVEESINLVKCLNCGDHNAEKLCSKCHVASYCSRDCQVAHWKSTHKRECQAPDDVDLSGRVCQNCQKKAATLRFCNKCMKSSYCSRRCLLEHYPQHRSTCKSNRRTLQVATEHGQASEYRLLEAWKMHAKVLLAMVGTHAMTKQQFLEQPPSFVVTVTVQFDFNCSTFLPVSQELVPDESLPADVMNAVQQVRQHCSDLSQRASERQLYHVFIVVDDVGLNSRSIVPIGMAATGFRAHSLADANRLIRSTIKLNPPLLNSWIPLAMKNIKQQVNAIKVNGGDKFTHFLLNALRVYCTKPRYKTHTVLVSFKLGFGLGEIADVDGFKVIKLSDARQIIQGMGANSDRALLDLDVEKSPRLLQSRIKFPRNVMLAIIWKPQDSDSLIFADPCLYQLEVGMPLRTPKKCEKLANDCFQALQAIERPKVKSPPLSSVSVGI